MSDVRRLDGSFAARTLAILALTHLALGCSGGPGSDPDAGSTDAGSTDAGSADAGSADAGTTDAARPSAPSTLGPSERPADLLLPRGYDGTTPAPVVFLLHGYGASGAVQDAYFGLSRAARSRGFYVVIPDGTVDASGRRFWNATPACCDFADTGVDDVAYLTGLLDELEAAVPVSSVYFVGHSNGGFMSYRMACELSARVDAIASLAGADFLNDDDCVPDEPVSVLQIHGDLDSTILYAGSPGAYPSASSAVERWAARAGCDLAAPSPEEALDLETSVAGAETDRLAYRSGCAEAEAELWTIRGGGHIPSLDAGFAPALLDWLSAH